MKYLRLSVCGGFVGSLISLSVALTPALGQRAFIPHDLGNDAATTPPWLERVEASGSRPQKPTRLKPGPERQRLSVATPSDAVVLRTRVKIDSADEGFSPLLSWGDISLAVSFEGGVWRLFRLDESGTGWAPTEFSLRQDALDQWVAIDIVRPRGPEGLDYMLFVDGVSISGLERRSGAQIAGLGELAIHQSDFATVEVRESSTAVGFPEYVIRALRRYGFHQEVIADTLALDEIQVDGIEHRRQARPEEERRLAGEYPKIRREVFAGDLTFLEEAWFQTYTLNRSYFQFDASFDLDRAYAWNERLELMGADYIPALEGRGWTAPWSYSDWSDHYIEKIYGYLTPEMSGNYRFWVSGDEAGALFLSDSTDPAEVRKIAGFSAPTGQYEWTATPEQQSAEIYLEAGVPRYFELWHVEQTGRDHIAVAWTKPEASGVAPELIPSSVISSFAAGAPGTYPRHLYPRDESLLPEPDDLPLEDPSARVQFTDLANPTVLRGDRPINIADFDWGGTRYHANEGGGFEDLYTDEELWPEMYASDLGVYLDYTTSTANPQVFYRSNYGLYANYHAAAAQVVYLAEPIPHYWDFEAGLGDWLNNTTGDDFDWTHHSGVTSSSNTGPDNDHTKQNSLGKYMYLETSSGPGYSFGNDAILTGPKFSPAERGAKFLFYYHMYGADIGRLNVQVQKTGPSGPWYTEWTRITQQHTSSDSDYLLGEIDLDPYVNKYIRFRFQGIVMGGYRGDTAIDHIGVLYEWADSDDDGLSDYFEFLTLRTDPTSVDTDGDGLHDGWEDTYGYNPLLYNYGGTDSDGDGATLLQEGTHGTNPNVKDHWEIALELF